MLLGLAAAGGGWTRGSGSWPGPRTINPQPFRRPLPPYPEIVWTRLTQACQAAVTDGLPGAPGGPGRGGRAARIPPPEGCDLDNLRWLLARNGPMAIRDVAAHAGPP